MNKAVLAKKIDTLVTAANFSLRGDIQTLLARAYRREKSTRAKKALGWILENAQLASHRELALCQDTGLPVIFVEVGKGVCFDLALVDFIKTQVEKSYRQHSLRPSLVDPLRRDSPSFSGALCHIEFVHAAHGIRITVLPKGFGCENKSQLKMFNPTVSLRELEAFVIESVRAAGPEACPPFVVGVGIGGTSDYALLLAKKALLRDVDRPNINRDLRRMEQRLYKHINALGIGAMGLGGYATALAVKIKKAPTHIAGLPVGVNISCHALRSATFTLK